MKRASHVCPIPGCPEIVSGSARYCPEHTRLMRPKDTRPSAASRGYDAEWQKIRAAFLAAHPHCSLPGCTRPSTDADHIVAKRDGGSDDWDNLRAYCHSHHSKRTAKDQPGGFNKNRRLHANSQPYPKAA